MLRPLPRIDFGRCARLTCSPYLLKNEQRFSLKLTSQSWLAVTSTSTTDNPISQLNQLHPGARCFSSFKKEKTNTRHSCDTCCHSDSVSTQFCSDECCNLGRVAPTNLLFFKKRLGVPLRIHGHSNSTCKTDWQRYLLLPRIRHANSNLFKTLARPPRKACSLQRQRCQNSPCSVPAAVTPKPRHTHFFYNTCEPLNLPAVAATATYWLLLMLKPEPIIGFPPCIIITFFFLKNSKPQNCCRVTNADCAILTALRNPLTATKKFQLDNKKE
jgi:hypothetical protein